MTAIDVEQFKIDALFDLTHYQSGRFDINFDVCVVWPYLWFWYS